MKSFVTYYALKKLHLIDLQSKTMQSIPLQSTISKKSAYSVYPWLILLILTLVSLTSETSSFMSVSQNRKYINAGTVTLNIASAVSWNFFAVNATYPFSFNSTVQGIFLTINNMEIDSFSNVSFYGIVDSFTQTLFTLNAYSNTSNIIRSLGYRYVAIAFKDNNSYGWILKTFVQKVNLIQYANGYCNSYSVEVPLDGIYNLQFSDSNQYAISILGYDLATTSSIIQLLIQLDERWYLNATSVSARIKPCSNYYYYYYDWYYGGPNITIRAIHFNILIHNRSFDTTNSYIRSKYYYLVGQNNYYHYYTYGTYTYVSYSYIDGNQIPNYYGLIYGPATLFSINQTRFNNYSTPQFSLSVSDYSSKFTSKSYSLWFGVTITYFYTFYCPYSTPYLLDTICYDVCPNSSTTNETWLTCSTNSTSNPTTNTTNITNLTTVKDSMSPALQIGSILAFVCFILLLVLIIFVFCLFKKIKKQPQPKYVMDRSLNQLGEIDTRSNIPADNKIIVRIKPPSESEIGVWRQNSIDPSAECSLCHNRHTYLSTECGHSFHVKCIVEWSNKYAKCPNCTDVLTQKHHRLLCRFCKSKEKWMKFQDVKLKFQENTLSSEFICPSCLMNAF